MKALIYLLDVFYFCKNTLQKALSQKKNRKSDLAYLNALDKSPYTIESNSKILLLELNNFHFEILDSIIYYFKRLGYDTDVVVRAESSYQNAIKLELGQILGLDTSKYDFVFFNTMYLSLKSQHHISSLININAKYGILGLYHTISDIARFDDMANYKQGRYFALRKLSHKGLSLNALSCSKSIDIPFATNPKATFISIGFPLYHRNFREILYESIGKLLKDGITNFRFILIGRSAFKDLKFKEYVCFFCNPSAKELHQILKSHNPHYTLGIFDNFAHRHYLYDSTSGLRGFSLTYNLPLLINRRFGESFGFDTTNAILWDSSLYHSLKYAISIINTEAYTTYKQNLYRYNERLNEDSIATLRATINRLKDKR